MPELFALAALLLIVAIVGGIVAGVVAITRHSSSSRS